MTCQGDPPGTIRVQTPARKYNCGGTSFLERLGRHHSHEKRNRFVSSSRKLLLLILGWVVFVTALHLWLNTMAFDPGSWRPRGAEQQFRVGFLPVTCHLTCPVTHYINDNMN